MACQNTQTVYTRSLKLKKGSPLFNSFACGVCSDCLKHKQREYYVRAWIEHQNVIKKHGWSLFETLTYNLHTVPMERGYMCFNSHHIDKFFDVLRKRLNRLGYKYNNDTVRCMVVCEFGSDDLYVDNKGRIRKAMQMPHYHLTFNVTPESGLTPAVLRKAIRQVWSVKGELPHQENKRGKKLKGFGFGHTDNSPLESRVINSNAVIHYLVKYITKAPDYADKVEMISKKHHKPFYRCSQHYGENILDYFKLDDIMEKGCVYIAEFQSTKVPYALPRYNFSKLFNKKVVSEDGKVRYELNELGREYKLKRLDNLIKTNANTMRDFYMNANESIREKIDNMLAGRSFEDLATYQLVFRNRVSFRDFGKQENPFLYYKRYLYTDEVLYVRYDSKDKEFFKNYGQCNRQFDAGDSFDKFFEDTNDNTVPREKIKRITQNYNRAFRSFDTLLDYIKYEQLINDWTPRERANNTKALLQQRVRYHNIYN